MLAVSCWCRLISSRRHTDPLKCGQGMRELGHIWGDDEQVSVLCQDGVSFAGLKGQNCIAMESGYKYVLI